MKMFHATLLTGIVALASVNALQIITPLFTDLDGAKCIKVKDNNYANGSPIEINDCSNTAQVLTLSRDPSKNNGEIRIGDFCVDAIDVQKSNKLVLWKCNQSQQQQFNFTGITVYNVKTAINLISNTDLCIDVPYSSTDNGNQLQTYACSKNQNQDWETFKLSY